MTLKVKICGLKTEAAMAAALDGGADYVGLVFYPPSPRHVSIKEARALAAMARGKAQIVALFVDPDDAALGTVIGEVGPDMVQLHGSESLERVADIARRWNLPVMKAIKVADKSDAARARDYAGASAIILFDAKPPKGNSGVLPGGTGMAFDWRALDDVKHQVTFMLSGGLTAENVAAAANVTGAAAVDVSSGVETAPGVKDPGLIARFLSAAKASGL